MYGAKIQTYVLEEELQIQQKIYEQQLSCLLDQPMTKKQILNTKHTKKISWHLGFSHQPIQWKFIICDSSDDPIRLQIKV